MRNEIIIKNKNRFDSIKILSDNKISLIKEALLRLYSTKHSSALELFLLFVEMILKMSVDFGLLFFVVFHNGFNVSLLTHVVLIYLTEFNKIITC